MWRGANGYIHSWNVPWYAHARQAENLENKGIYETRSFSDPMFTVHVHISRPSGSRLFHDDQYLWSAHHDGDRDQMSRAHDVTERTKIMLLQHKHHQASATATDSMPRYLALRTSILSLCEL